MTKHWVHRAGYSPVHQILLQIVMKAVITTSQPAWTTSAGVLSTQADFSFFIDCTAASTSLPRMGWSSSLSVWRQLSSDGYLLILWLYSSEQYSVQCSISVRHFPDCRSFSLFHSSQVFHELACPLAVVLPQIFYNLTPVLFCLFHPLLVRFPVFFRSLRFESSLSQFSPFVTQITNICKNICSLCRWSQICLTAFRQDSGRTRAL